MKTLRGNLMTASFAIMVFAGAALAILMTSGAAPLSARSERSGSIHLTKTCAGTYNGNAGDYCTVTASNSGPILANSRVYYDQAVGVPVGLLDSNVVLDAGAGNRAFGRCTLDLSTGTGLCTFSDGTGQFAGFQARIQVTPLGSLLFGWDGTYSFAKDQDRD